MNLPRYARVLLAIGSGVALGLSFPNYNLYLLAWIALGMLVLASCGVPLKEAPLYGFLHGQVFYPVCLPWVDTVMRQYGNIDPWISAAFVGMIGFVGGLICMIFSTGVALASKKNKLLACLLAPFLWTALEFFRTNIPIIGSSWDLSGYPAARSMALLQITSVTGIYGLCFLIAAYGSLLAYAVLADTRRAWKLAVVITIVLVVVALGGPYLIPSARPHYIAHLVQTNFPQSESYPADWLQVHSGDLDQLEQISVEAGHRVPGIIIWPEVPAPFTFTEQPFAQRAERIARDAGNYFLVGVVDWKQDTSGKWLASNSAVLLNPVGQRIYSLQQNSSAAVRRIRPPSRLAYLRQKTNRGHFRFHSGLAIHHRAAPAGKIWHVHLLRSNFPERSAPLHCEWRRIAGNDFERRLVRPLLRPRTAHGDGARPRGRKSPLAAARHQQRLHRIDRSLWPHSRPIAIRHSRPARRPLRFPQRPNSLRPIRRLVLLAMHHRNRAADRYRPRETNRIVAPASISWSAEARLRRNKRNRSTVDPGEACLAELRL